MKILFFLVLLLYLLPEATLPAEELSEAVIAQRILKDEGFQMFHFDPTVVAPRQMVLRYKAKKGALNDRTKLPEGKKYVVTIQTGQNHVLKSMRVDWEKGTFTTKFPEGSFTSFNHAISSSSITENDPFFALEGPDGELQIMITPRTDG